MRYYAYVLVTIVACLPIRTLAQNGRHLGDDQLWRDEVRSAMRTERWDHALRRLEPVLDYKPEDLEARLLRGICYREKARHVFVTVRSQFFLDPGVLKDARKSAVLSARGGSRQLEVGHDYDVTKAIFDFEYILDRDSSYQEVLVEYARLWHDHEVFDLAIALGEAQFRLSSTSPRVHEELIATYRHYIAWTSTTNALEMLSGRRSSYAQFFIGEVLRRDGRMQQADSIYSALQLERELPTELILLSRARVAVAQKRFEEAQAFINAALNFQSVLGARLLLEDFKYVLDPIEYADSKSLRTVTDFRDFYARMWARRNPLPASRMNWRLIEHYRRLVNAERDYSYFGPRVKRLGRHEDPNGFVDASTFPPGYWETRGFNDKGLIYIRHGEPDDRIVTQPRPGVGMNESWRYRAEDLDFHFYISETDGRAYSWPLVPLLANCYMAFDRREWGGYYNQLSPRPQFVNTPDPAFRTDPCGPDAEPRNNHDVSIAISHLADEGNAAIARGLRSDRHTWIDDEIEAFGFPIRIATFRGSDEATDVNIFFALPVGFLGQKSRRDTFRWR